MWAQVINIIMGLIVMIAPDVWHFNSFASHHNHIVGPLVITFAAIALWEVNRTMRLFNIITGFWLIFSPLFITFSTTGLNINIFAGIIIVALSIFKGQIKNSYGGGWRSLLQKNPLHMQQEGDKK